MDTLRLGRGERRGDMMGGGERDFDGKEDAERWGKEGEAEINGRARVWLTPRCESSIKDTSF